MRVHYAIVAPVGGGKTTALRWLVQRFPGKVAGVLAERVGGDPPEGYELVFVPTGERWPYVRSRPPGVRVGRFWIRLEVIQRASEGLAVEQPDLWVLDEVGPLELLRGQGWFSWLERRLAVPAPPVVLTLRSALEPWLRQRFPGVAWRMYAPAEVPRLLEALLRGREGRGKGLQKPSPHTR